MNTEEKSTNKKLIPVKLVRMSKINNNSNSSSRRGRGGRAPGARNYDDESLIKIIDRIRPTLPPDWVRVAEEYYAENDEENGLRKPADIKKHFETVLARKGVIRTGSSGKDIHSRAAEIYIDIADARKALEEAKTSLAPKLTKNVSKVNSPRNDIAEEEYTEREVRESASERVSKVKTKSNIQQFEGLDDDEVEEEETEREEDGSNSMFHDEDRFSRLRASVQRNNRPVINLDDTQVDEFTPEVYHDSVSWTENDNMNSSAPNVEGKIKLCFQSVLNLFTIESVLFAIPASRSNVQGANNGVLPSNTTSNGPSVASGLLPHHAMQDDHKMKSLQMIMQMFMQQSMQQQQQNTENQKHLQQQQQMQQQMQAQQQKMQLQQQQMQQQLFTLNQEFNQRQQEFQHKQINDNQKLFMQAMQLMMKGSASSKGIAMDADEEEDEDEEDEDQT
jgi:hypothetical protein